MIAALYVERNGVYFGLPDVDPWDEARDARKYAGPWRVIAHPPCARWGRYWFGSPSDTKRYKLGDDGGCFAAALAAVRKWGGVLEHPEGSRAWRAHDLMEPPRSGGWVVADWDDGWTCCVEQGWYGHRARKPTWLYACGIGLPPSMKWDSAPGVFDLIDRSDKWDRKYLVRCGVVGVMSARQRAATPAVFRDVLLEMVK